MEIWKALHFNKKEADKLQNCIFSWTYLRVEISEQPSILKSKVSQVHSIRVRDLRKCFLGGLSWEKGHVNIHQARFQVKSCCCSGDKSCLTLCDPMNCSMPSFPVLHYLYEFAQKLMSLESVMPFNHLVLSPPSPPVLALSASGSCPRSQLFSLGGQRIGASASASVLSMNIEGWFPSGLTGLIFLLPKGLSKVSSTTSQKLQVFSAQPHLWS